MILSEKIDKVTVVSLGAVKNFDSIVSFRVKSELKGLITERNIRLVIDFEGVQRIDSAGFGVLISAFILVKNLDGQVKLCGLAPKIYDLFEQLNLDKVFQVYEAREEAINSFAYQKAFV